MNSAFWYIYAYGDSWINVRSVPRNLFKPPVAFADDRSKAVFPSSRLFMFVDLNVSV